MFVVYRNNMYLRRMQGMQYPEWTDNIHEAYHFDRSEIHRANEFIDVFGGVLQAHDPGSGEMK